MSDRLFKGEEGLGPPLLQASPISTPSTPSVPAASTMTPCCTSRFSPPAARKASPCFPCERIYCDVARACPRSAPQYYERFRAPDRRVQGRDRPEQRLRRRYAADGVGRHRDRPSRDLPRGQGLHGRRARHALPDGRFGQFGPGVRELVEKAKAFVRRAVRYCRRHGTGQRTLPASVQDMELLREQLDRRMQAVQAAQHAETRAAPWRRTPRCAGLRRSIRPPR
jgi:hypothetical protein